MKIQNIYHLLQAALLLLLVSCTQEEFPAVQDKAQQLTISVTDGGYTSAVENMKTRVETRAVENGYTTEFTEGDACGFYMVRGGKPVYSNVKLTAEKEGVQKVFGTLDLFVSLLETEIKYPILQGGILPFWTPSSAVFISQGIGSCRDRFSAPASGMTFCPWRSCP